MTRTDMADPVGQSNGEAEKTKEQAKAEFLWSVIGRYDSYIGSTNTKGALLGTFNTFVLGTIVLKWKDLQTALAGHPHCTTWAGIFVVLAAAATVVSLGFVFAAIHPFLKSYKKVGGYHSNIFFVHVAEHPNGEDYRKSVMDADDAKDVTDLSHQAHVLAKGLGAKMVQLQRSVIATVASLAAILGVIVCLFIASVA